MAAPTPFREIWNLLSAWIARHPRWTLVLVVTLTLGPFLGKPFNMDDPLFLWIGHQIQRHPADPYGFSVNWYGSAEPMWNVTENPPLACYYIALAAATVGWTEPALHVAFLLPAIAAVLGTYRLASRWCDRPILAACASFFTPVFLVSSMTLMSDVLMLAFWVWAVVWWIEGIDQNDFRRLLLSSLMVALAVMTKYFGVCLMPLLAAYGAIQRRSGWQTLFLIIPITALGFYQWATHALYGHGLFSYAMDYAGTARSRNLSSMAASGLTGLSFTGGCLAVVICFAPWLWRPRFLALAAGSMVPLFLLARLLGSVLMKDLDSHLSIELQISFWAASGLTVLMLAGADLWTRRTADGWLLGLWIAGTFCFAAFVNWTANGRSILPMAPAVGILLVRRLQWNSSRGRTITSAGLLSGLSAGALIAVVVAAADFGYATAVRRSAEQADARYGRKNATLWFEGHWGFQYYLEKSGALPFDVKRSLLKPGDALVLPDNNTSLYPVNDAVMSKLESFSVPGPWLVTTWNEKAGAGFYAAAGGPVPFVFGSIPPETVTAYQLKPSALPAAK